MSAEIIKNERIERGNLIKNDLENNKTVDEDYMVKTIGAFGLWHAAVSVTVFLTRAIAMWNMLSIAFLTPSTEFICIQFSDNVTIEPSHSICYDNCLKYNYSSVIGRSIVEDFELVCQNAWKASFTQSVLMMGVLVGSSFFGWTSDRYGRRTALLFSTFLNAVFMVILPFSPSYLIFTSIRFVIGVATGGSFIIGVVQVMEIIGKAHREIAGACILIPDSLAQISLAGFAYFTSDWQRYTLSYGVVMCFTFVLVLFVPESPRWLMANGRVDETVKVITRAAVRNKLDASNVKFEITKAISDMKLKEIKIVRTSYLDFFRSKVLLKLSLTVFIIWVTQGICFWGIYQYMAIIGVDLYLTVVILGLVEIPICLISIIVSKKFTRKTSSIWAVTGIAIVMAIIIFIPKSHWSVTMLGALGFIFISVFCSLAYIYIAELFPTPVRNMSYGLASSGSKIGGMLAPFVANLSPSWLPSLVFCILSTLSVLCCLSLPETKGQNLKDTVEY